MVKYRYFKIFAEEYRRYDLAGYVKIPEEELKGNSPTFIRHKVFSMFEDGEADHEKELYYEIESLYPNRYVEMTKEEYEKEVNEE